MADKGENLGTSQSEVCIRWVRQTGSLRLLSENLRSSALSSPFTATVAALNAALSIVTVLEPLRQRLSASKAQPSPAVNCAEKLCLLQPRAHRVLPDLSLPLSYECIPPADGAGPLLLATSA